MCYLHQGERPGITCGSHSHPTPSILLPLHRNLPFASTNVNTLTCLQRKWRGPSEEYRRNPLMTALGLAFFIVWAFFMVIWRRSLSGPHEIGNAQCHGFENQRKLAEKISSTEKIIISRHRLNNGLNIKGIERRRIQDGVLKVCDSMGHFEETKNTREDERHQPGLLWGDE